MAQVECLVTMTAQESRRKIGDCLSSALGVASTIAAGPNSHTIAPSGARPNPSFKRTCLRQAA